MTREELIAELDKLADALAKESRWGSAPYKWAMDYLQKRSKEQE